MTVLIMQCSKTNIMCKGGHLLFSKQRIFVMHPISKEVIELKDSNRIKHLAPSGEIALLAISKSEFKNAPETDDFTNPEKRNFIKRVTTSKKISGSMHLDRPENEGEKNDRVRVANKIVARVLHDEKFKGDRDRVISKGSQEIMNFFESRGFIDSQEIIANKIAKGEVKNTAGLLNFLKTVPSMAEELGLSKGSYQSNNFDLSPILLKLNPVVGAKPAKAIYLSPNNVDSHAVIRFFERVVPRLSLQHVEVAREILKERDSIKKRVLKEELGLLLKREGVNLVSSQDAKVWLSNIITDKIGSSLADKNRPTFADRSGEKNSTGRFVLSIGEELTGFNSKLEVVCDVLRERPGSDSIEIRVISLWRENQHHKREDFNNSESSAIMKNNSIWDFNHPDPEIVSQFARATEKVIFDAFI